MTFSVMHIWHSCQNISFGWQANVLHGGSSGSVRPGAIYTYICCSGFVTDSLKVGPLAIWIEMLPCAMGVGVAMIILSLIVAVYYNVIMAYCLHYLFNSMR